MYTGNDKSTKDPIVTHRTKRNSSKVTELLRDVIGNDWSRINNQRYYAKKLGYTELPFETQLKNAEIFFLCVESKNCSAGDYHLLKNNCEHLVTYFKYGKSFSGQVKDFYTCRSEKLIIGF